MKSLMFLATRKSWMSHFPGLAVPRGLQKQFLIARTLCIVVAWFLALVSPCQALDYPIPANITDTPNLGLIVNSFRNNTGTTVNDLWIYGYVFPGNPPVNPMEPGPGTEYTFTAIGPGGSYAPGNGGNGFQILSQSAYVAEGQFDPSKIIVYGYWTFNGIPQTPEPATLVLLGLGGLAILRRRRCSK